jgi:hypothetical protein
MTNVKIGNKTIAFPSDMKDSDLEKAIRKLKIDFAVDAVKGFKPASPVSARSSKKKGGRVMKARGGRVMRRK